jgi:hypothetical protein
LLYIFLKQVIVFLRKTVHRLAEQLLTNSKTMNSTDITLPVVKPYSLTELANMYGVSKKIFRHWLEPFKDAIGKRQGFYYTVQQVEIIFDSIGMPPEV